MRIIRTPLIVNAISGLSPTAVKAATSCDQFKAAMSEGAAEYQAPLPKFWLEHVNSADANIQYFTISMFDDARAMMACSYGEVETFAADANGTSPTSIVHTMLLAAMALHGYGLEWRQALKMRDQLVSLAKASDRQMSEVHVEGGKASLVISVVGVPSFQIDTDH
jgi:hypothetical protein